MIKAVAKLTLFEGPNMRKNPFFSGYRPIFEFAGTTTKQSGRIDLRGSENFYPGTTGIVFITFLSGVLPSGNLNPGQAFAISEGGQYNLGEGVILELLNDK